VPEPIELDTSGLLAAIDAAQRKHREAREVLEHTDAALLLSPFVLAELDYLLAAKVGAREQLALLGEVERGAYRLESFSATDVARARHIMERYADLALGLAGRLRPRALPPPRHPQPPHPRRAPIPRHSRSRRQATEAPPGRSPAISAESNRPSERRCTILGNEQGPIYALRRGGRQRPGRLLVCRAR